MFDDLAAVFAATKPTAARTDYVSAIIEGNCLGKPTTSTRKLSLQRLTELYALDPSVALFRVFRRLCQLDSVARPLLAHMCAIARDPLLAATVTPVLSLMPGAEFQRDAMKKALLDVVGERFNESILVRSSRWPEHVS